MTHPLLSTSVYAALFAGLILSTVCTADQHSIGTITRVEGTITITNSTGHTQEIQDHGVEIYPSDQLRTHENSKASIHYDDGSVVVMNGNSQLKSESKSFFHYLAGKIYFLIKKKKKEEVQTVVKTPVATIGIRGTKFIVYDKDKQNAIALKQGLLDIQSPGPAFEYHKTQALNEFEAYKAQLQNGSQAINNQYQHWKKAQQTAFVAYKKSFLLEANSVVRFDQQKASESSLSADDLKDFGDFENFIFEQASN